MPNDGTQKEQGTAVQTRQLPTVVDDGAFGMLLDTNKFAQLQRIGTMYARSKMVPQHFQGDEPSCMVAVQMAMRLGIDPFMFLQKTYVVGGKPGMEAPLVIALINTRGPFKGPVNWDLKRDDKGDVVECTAYATHRETGTVCSSTVTWKMVEAEGWSKKNGSKWLTLREQMFKYRSAAFLGRLYCPEVLMGMATADELHDQEIDVTPAANSAGEALVAPRRSLKDRIVGAAVIDGDISTVAGAVGKTNVFEVRETVVKRVPEPSLADMGITVDDGPVVGSGAAAEGQAPLDGMEGAASAVKAPALPYDSLLAHAKSAKTSDQVDIVRDAMRDTGYTAGQRAEVEVILKSKKIG